MGNILPLQLRPFHFQAGCGRTFRDDKQSSSQQHAEYGSKTPYDSTSKSVARNRSGFARSIQRARRNQSATCKVSM
jgi:hypothetical protein